MFFFFTENVRQTCSGHNQGTQEEPEPVVSVPGFPVGAYATTGIAHPTPSPPHHLEMSTQQIECNPVKRWHAHFTGLIVY